MGLSPVRELMREMALARRKVRSRTYNKSYLDRYRSRPIVGSRVSKRSPRYANLGRLSRQAATHVDITEASTVVNVGYIYFNRFTDVIPQNNSRGGTNNNLVFLHKIRVHGVITNPNTARTDAGRARFALVQNRIAQASVAEDVFESATSKNEPQDYLGGDVLNLTRDLARWKFRTYFDKLYPLKVSATGSTGPKDTIISADIPINKLINISQNSGTDQVTPEFKLLHWYETDGGALSFTGDLTTALRIVIYFTPM